MALPEEKREMVNICTSNREVEGKKVELKPSLAFQEIANRFNIDDCGPYRIRTGDLLIANEALYQLS